MSENEISDSEGKAKIIPKEYKLIEKEGFVEINKFLSKPNSQLFLFEVPKNVNFKKKRKINSYFSLIANY